MIDTKLTEIIAGPILRHCSPTEFTLWLVTSAPLQAELQVFAKSHCLFSTTLGSNNTQQLQLGRHCFMQLIHIKPEQKLPLDQELQYDLNLATPNGNKALADLIPDICYPGYSRPHFVIKSRIDKLMHGSCRKPHHPEADALTMVDQKIAASAGDISKRPALLLMTGDQIYADDVAGPSLAAIHQVIKNLGLFEEQWQGAVVSNQTELEASPLCYYQREQLLPDDDASQALVNAFFRGARKPIFTSVGAHNHLISFAEVLAMYLLAWSPEPWQPLNWQQAREAVQPQFLQRFDRELEVIQDFANSLPQVRRALAHIPNYMIFDDHDITDDWNLTRGWEEAAYNNPFSKRIIGNALLAYWLCQGWGNKPDNYQNLAEQCLPLLQQAQSEQRDQLIDHLMAWQHWHYHLDTSPKLIVLDTRTQRWRSESSANKPSGLMDWESLSELQQELIGEDAVIMVSPAPVFGVKFIEVVQKVFTFFGKPLMVDAENWMAHPGAANVILNIFRHGKTPPNFIILSGDVHYSFAYDITLRFRKHSPKILQITASGIKNAFPDKLLKWLDRINLFLYGSRSPFNWLTRRRDMLIKRRRPKQQRSRVLYNRAAIGEVEIGKDTENTQVRVINSSGDVIEFK